MLKALELTGFKSFADRTRFDFPRGISIIVGPNGSGKSNIVDAVKWVLGSQSAKSLRGKEMTDVIFNGTASRGPMGTGEATLILDNADRRLAIDAPEVYVTRRVYRSGEGEYLINRQPCRLRDIRELLVGTGITTEAYCIIEQGRVDALLQSSPRDRRLIFEEAAGISQFKIKKAAAMRRLERVEQNLLRLSDIVDEVESRLRSVRSQAGKARRYRECAARLEFLRTELGLADWRALTEQISAHDEQAADLCSRQAEREDVVERCEAALAEVEQHLESRDQRLREIESAASATREQIAARQAAVESLAARRGDLEHDLDRFRRQLLAMTHSNALGDGLQQLAVQLEAAQAALASARVALASQLVSAEEAKQECESAGDELESLQARYAEAAQSHAALTHSLKLLESQLATEQGLRDDLRAQAAQLAEDVEQCQQALTAARQSEAERAADCESLSQIQRAAEHRLAAARDELRRADRQQRELESRLTRVRERALVLAELEHRMEGIDGSVQGILRAARESPDSPFRDVRGVVADLFHVDMDTAPLVELALGERAQYLVVPSGSRLLEALDMQPLGAAGRIGFLRLDVRTPPSAQDHVDLSAEPGVMGRADCFVEIAPEYAPLLTRLLGRTWFVDRLSTALRLAQSDGRGLEFVTASGELLTADGTLIIGTPQPAIGMLSRRGEMRVCNEQIDALTRQLEQQMATHERLVAQAAKLEHSIAASTSAFADATARLAQCRERSSLAVGQLEQSSEAHRQVTRRLDAAVAETDARRVELEQTLAMHVAVQTAVEELRAGVNALRTGLPDLETRAAHLQASVTDMQVAAAKCEERVAMLRVQAEQLRRDQQQRDESLADAREQVARRETQLAEIDAAILADRQTLAALYLEKERHGEALAAALAADESLRRQRSELGARLRAERSQVAAIQAQLHKLEVTTNKLRHELETLCERMQDDYGIDLAKAAGEAASAAAHTSPPHLDPRADVEREIADLRSQLNSIGAVNLDALEELDELESRFGHLSQQYRDLVDAKAALERIVQRINIDSRQIFVTTLEMVRGHFQELFRRLFGGGEADIVVDDAEDVLECGIEIVARPPGKEACSISLLSGGEKTLTCVALLLAVFRSKPSPFCVLDEVDAALDEANIGRFIQVLREFLSFTQFIVVSHSKRTMAGADTLYGVTMEESGVSKRVSVRFEDVSDDGQINPNALRGESPPQDDGADLAPARRAA